MEPECHKDNFLSRFWNPDVKRLTPYTPGDQSDACIKLNTNENPYPPSPEVYQSIKQEVGSDLRLYPDPDATALTSALSEFHGIGPDQILAGNGSDEILALMFFAFFNRSRHLLIPDISYSFYRVYCRLYNQPWLEIPLNENLMIVPEMYQIKNGGILFPNPNAPTGLPLSFDQLKFMIKTNFNSVVVIDEAYIDFGGETTIGLLNEYENLVIVRTFSKSRSLAGLRVGYAVSNPKMIEALKRVKNSFNSYPLDRLAIAGAVASVKDNAYFNNTCHKIITTREWFSKCLRKMGYRVIPSQANFLLFSHPTLPAEDIFNLLRMKKIWVRHFQESRIDNYIRISIGTDEEMNFCLSELQHIILCREVG